MALLSVGLFLSFLFQIPRWICDFVSLDCMLLGRKTAFIIQMVKSMTTGTFVLGRVAQSRWRKCVLRYGKVRLECRELWIFLCTIMNMAGLIAVGWWGHEVAITERNSSSGIGWTNGAGWKGKREMSSNDLIENVGLWAMKTAKGTEPAPVCLTFNFLRKDGRGKAGL